MRTRTLALFTAACALFATEPNDATRRWWTHVQALSGDDLKGRDTGSEGYRLAAQYVVEQLSRAGVRPAGENGWYQRVPLKAVRFRADLSQVELVARQGTRALRWLHDISIPARANLPETIDAGLIFEGTQGGPAAELRGKIVVRLGAIATAAAGLPGNAGAAADAAPGVLGILTIDGSGGTEPPRWPVPYAVTMTLADTVTPPSSGPLPLRFNPSAADALFAGSGHTYQELLALAAADKPLPRFALAQSLRARIKVEASEMSCNNILGVLPGNDSEANKEYVVVSAHLDGYGIGEARNGDTIYNGAFDDAAYVATLIDMAEQLQASGKRLRRSIFFAVFTAEEKGLLGSRYFAAHPTVAKERMVANVNLDQLRPIFPLTTLTTLALGESTVGDTVRQVALPMGIRIQPDPEPGRNLLRRSDHWNFMQLGVPAVGFVFGYAKDSPEESIYRRWYLERYHSPADDVKQPWDPQAAAKFNAFFGRLVEALADAAQRPRWKPGSVYAPKGAEVR
ncbi:MAG: M28 family peptidase [Candidatus Solibacter sp.]